MIISLLRIYHQMQLRGRNRLAIALANLFPNLQNIFLSTPNGNICVDLRIPTTHYFLTDRKETSEDIIMKKVVKEGDTVYDIGANLGYYSLLLSDLVGASGKVYSFEPNSEILKNLQSTLNAKTNTVLIPVALSDQDGEATLYVPEDVSMASLGNWTKEGKYGGEIHKTSCKVRKLDSVIKEENLPFPQFVKCDVEGAESLVVRGGMSIFNKIEAPIFMFEANAAATKGLEHNLPVVEFLNSLEFPQYKYFEILPDGNLKPTLSSNFQWSNLLAVPACKINDFH